MKYRMISLIFLALIFCFPSLLGGIMETLTWIFSLKFKGAPMSIIRDIFLRYTGPTITCLVMTYIHIKNKEINNFVLSIAGIVISFILSYVVMIFEQYGYIILALFFAFLTFSFTLLRFATKSKKSRENC